MAQDIIYSQSIARELELLRMPRYDKYFLVTETTVRERCLPLLGDATAFDAVACIEPGDDHKNLESLTAVWNALQQGGASRHSLVVNLGGGMLTDLGGFAAATFKRGMHFVNIPTTLLAMVDAAVGGKTGINFNGFKNEVGCFCEARKVIIDTEFLRTLDHENLCSGYAEMLKHSLLGDEAMWAEHLRFDLDRPDYAELQRLVGQSIDTKCRIVSEDPTEQGIRKALNLGHTVGHALESLALLEGRPGLHGYFVAWGLVAELYLSVALAGFPADRMRQTVQFVQQHYGRFAFTCDHYERLYELMRHDKKNTGGVISMTLLGNVGDIRIDCHPTKDEVFESFDFLREG